MLSKILAVFFLLCATFGLSYLIMVNGWGLEVKSWYWVVGGYFGILVLHGMVSALSKEL